ncbi:MAG: nucleoside-diphosphate kinase [Gammaproteobacteria bacterium]|nr:nucleoside-diphosphate kinase [Gammaproteobacteria bacterium]
MSTESTLSIIKPDGVEKRIIGEIYSRFERAGLAIAAAKMMRLTPDQARSFYAVHKDRSFFDRLINFIASGPIMVQVLTGNDAIHKNRDLMGATNPKEAAPGTIRCDFARGIDDEETHRNIVHGSDSRESAEAEIGFFFKPEEIFVQGR